MVCLESREEMPARDWEIEEALGEGVTLHTRLGPKGILGENEKAIGLETLKVRSVFDAEGRFNPSFIEGTESTIPADTIILAIGQASDLSFIREEDQIEIGRRGIIAVDPETLTTSAPGIYAGGDVAFGPRLIIDAISDGQKAARAIDKYITGKERKKPIIKMSINRFLERDEDYERIPRQKIPTIPTDRRVGIAEVELGFPDEIAIKEGKRCLKCNINTIFNSSKCLLCGGCVSICPMSCYRLVRLDKIQGDQSLERLVDAKIKIPLASFYKAEDKGEILQRATAMIKDETLCIRCGLCEKRCPTGAITMETFQFEEMLVDD
jgi:ferredoxin